MNYKDYKKQLVKQTVECSGTKCVIVGVGAKAFKLGFKAPQGFSNKEELSTFFVNISDMSVEFKAQVDALIPSENDGDKDEFLGLL